MTVYTAVPGCCGRMDCANAISSYEAGIDADADPGRWAGYCGEHRKRTARFEGDSGKCTASYYGSTAVRKHPILTKSVGVTDHSRSAITIENNLQ